MNFFLQTFALSHQWLDLDVVLLAILALFCGPRSILIPGPSDVPDVLGGLK